MTTETMPERIFLQPKAGIDGETTWCEHAIFDDDVEYVRADLVDGDPNEPLSEGQYRWARRKDCGWEVGWVDDADGFCLVIDGMNYYEDELSAVGPVIHQPKHSGSDRSSDDTEAEC